jgi:cobalt-zinc-cadmium efflux system protein
VAGPRERRGAIESRESMAIVPAHVHVSPARVLLALTVTVFAAAVEWLGSARGNTLFLAADASHLLAHVGIFGVLLIPAARWHDRGEDLATIAVLGAVGLIALAIAGASLHRLAYPPNEPVEPSFMLLSLLGLAANLTTAYVFTDPARVRWSFRAALAHELADGGLTVAGLLGALVIRLFGWTWIDPALSLAISLWLGAWSARLLVRRARLGAGVWTRDGLGAARHEPDRRGAEVGRRSSRP